MKRKMIAMLLATGMVLSMAACGNGSGTAASTASTSEAAAEESTAEEAAEEEATEEEASEEEATEEEASEEEAAEEETETASGEDTGGFGVSPIYFYTNPYIMKADIDNVEYTPFGYYFFYHATGKDEINACIASEPETIDPGLISSVDGSTYVQHMYEGLMRYVKIDELAGDGENMYNTEIDYGMAESYEVSDDLMTYTFHLRDANWSDGEPVKADDFVYSWQRIVDPETASDYGYILDGIVENAAAIQAGEKEPSELGITAVDEKTLEIKLEAPTPYFVELCAFASLMPLRQDIIEANDTAWTDAENIVVNGPYIVTEWVHDSYIKMEPNEEYHENGTQGPKVINWYLSNSETANMSAYEAGDYDFVDDFPTDRTADLKESGDCHINDYVGTYYVYLSCDNIPDWRVRAAIMLAIDRDNIVENVTQQGQVPATGLVAAGIADSAGKNFAEESAKEMAPMWRWLQEQYGEENDLDLNEYEDRTELAQILLDEAVEDGFDTNATIYYRYNTNEAHQAIAEAIQSDVDGLLGLNMELTNQDWNVYTNGLAEHDFGVARLGWIADYNDPITYLELFSNGNSYNYGNYWSDEFTDLLTEAKALGAGAERDALLYEAEYVLFSGLE